MTTPRPLANRRIVELTQFIAGPTAAQMLADFGAQVIKIEPLRGDGSRELPGTRFGSAYFRCFNTGKESRVIDIGNAAGRAELDALMSQADAFICNLSPRALRRLGLGAGEILGRYPRLVATYVSGFGQNDDRTCMDTIAQCESGFAWMNGNLDGTPRVSTSWPVDFYCGHYAAFSTAMALLDGKRDGGIVIDLTMMDVASAMLLGPAALLLSEGERIGPPLGNRDRAAAPSGIFQCSDGHAYIYGGLDAYWAALRPVVGGRDADAAERMANAAEFDAAVENWTRARSVAEVLDIMRDLGIPAGAVRHPSEAIENIRAMSGGGTTMMDDGQHVPVYPAKFNGRRIARKPAPPLPERASEKVNSGGGT